MPPQRHADVQEGDTPAKALDFVLLRRLWFYIRPHQRWLWAGLACLLLMSGSRLMMPWLVKIALDDHLALANLEGYYPLVLLFLGVALVDATLRRLQQVLVETGGQSALRDLRVALFRHLQRLSASFFDRTSTGRLVGRVTTDVEALQELFASGVVTIAGDLLFLVATIVILFSLDPGLAAASMVVVPILICVTLFIRTRVRGAYVKMRSKLSEMNGFLHERISGMAVVQMFNRQEATLESYGEINQGVRGAQLRTVWWETLLSTSVELLSSMTIAVILWYGGAAVAQGWEAQGMPTGSDYLTLGVLFAFIDYMQKFFQPLNELSLKYTVMQNAMTAGRRVFDLLDVEEHLPEPESPTAPAQTYGELVFEGVHFAYDPGQPVLDGVSFRVAPGERVALVGATGAGKTTVLKLLTRLYDPQQGRIMLDGIDLREFSSRDLRRRIGLVPQDVFLFEGTILDNITLGHAEVDEERAIQVATRLHLDELVQRFPGGWHEPVRERGRNLSAGEKQLISFARVVAAAPPVLVLDEATSDVDSHTEHLLQEAVHDAMEGRTSLAIAHRLSTIRDVDRILLFHKGKLVEQGTHDELMRLDGRYRRLVELQFSS
jgi:ATP-binding cassette subfamily B multidrug efflux pump